MAPATTDGKRRFVDCHFHIWNANTHPAWYDFPDHDSAAGRKMGWKIPLPQVWTLRNHCEALDCVKLTKAVPRNRYRTPYLGSCGDNVA